MLDQVRLKQRVVGGIVLLSIAIILVPFLMDDPRQEVKILESNVPAWPEDQPLNLIDIKEEEFSPIVEPVAQGSQPSQSKTPAPVVERSTASAGNHSTKPQISADGKRWEVQVVSYSTKNRKRAERFLKRMQEKGYKVELKGGSKRLRLVTEPLSSNKAAKEMKKKIDRDFKVDKVDSMIRLLK